MVGPVLFISFQDWFVVLGAKEVNKPGCGLGRRGTGVERMKQGQAWLVLGGGSSAGP